jgi:hypothetical protein
LAIKDYRSYENYRKVNDDITSPTLYTLLANHFTLNIQGHTRRGVTQSLENTGAFSLAWIVGDFITADARVIDNFEDAVVLANRIKRWPSVIMTYYPGVDEIGHRYGPDSQKYSAALMNIDNVIGRVNEAYREAGLDKSTYYVLVSDHGMMHVDSDKRMDILEWLRDVRGLKVRTASVKANDYADRCRLLASYDVLTTVEAGRLAMVHLKGKRGWAFRPGPKEVFDWITTSPAIHELPCVGMVFARAGDNRVALFSHNGRAVIERKGDGAGVKYRVAKYVGDPLGYKALPEVKTLVGGNWYSSRDWLAATAYTKFPDCVPQAVEMFDSSRTGDVVIMAGEKASLSPKEYGGHGSCLQRDMRTVMYFAGPGLPAGNRIHHARLVDVMPTILGLLGEEQRLEQIGSVDGVNLTELLCVGVTKP